MKRSPTTVTGLMSGSSLDGIDLACCSFRKLHDQWRYRILAAHTYPYPPSLTETLRKAHLLSRDDLGKLDRELGIFYAGLIDRFHREWGMKPDLIASHGHTVLHDPDRGVTFQAGNGAVMAARSGIPVIHDFRNADVEQGGQGAPLVPVGDRFLFGNYDACLNLGGFANISFDNREGTRISFDICPVNLALNEIASRTGRMYDEYGDLAKQGTPDNSLLMNLNRLPFYLKDPPKSLGKEWYISSFLPCLEMSDLKPPDLLATLVEHICIQVEHVLEDSGVRTILVTGGGALNRFLMEKMSRRVRQELIIPELKLVQFKEAMIFAFLGLLRWRNEINCLASVTGGKKDLSAGVISLPA